MPGIREILWILFLGAFISEQFADASSIRDDIAVVRICNATNPVELGVFNSYMMHHDFESLDNHSRELSCFLLCIYSEYKWMDRNGNFRLHKIKSWMHRANLTLNDRGILVHKCTSIAELADPCSRARYFTECFWSNYQVSRNKIHGTGLSGNNEHTLTAIIRKKRAL